MCKPRKSTGSCVKTLFPTYPVLVSDLIEKLYTLLHRSYPLLDSRMAVPFCTVTLKSGSVVVLVELPVGDAVVDIV